MLPSRRPGSGSCRAWPRRGAAWPVILPGRSRSCGQGTTSCSWSSPGSWVHSHAALEHHERTCGGGRDSLPSEVSAGERRRRHAAFEEEGRVPGHSATQAFGPMLREWRGFRRKSQLDLALDAGISPRHLSFLESGRSAPSRDMVVVLAEALEVPFRDRDGLLLAAGYAPMHREVAMDSASWAQVQRALARLLEHQEPYPAVVLDRRWNVVQTNRAAPRLFARFTDLSVLPEPRNLLRSVFDPRGLRPWIANWDTVAHTLVRRVFREAVAGIPDPDVLATLRELGAWPEPASARRAAEGEA